MRWPWSRVEREQTRMETFQQWDGAYRWGGAINEMQPLTTFGAAGSLNAPDELLDLLSGLTSARVSRKDALRASVVLRARNLIAGVPSSLPLELRDKKSRQLDERTWLGEQPHPNLENTVMYAMTFEDLFFEGKSYWRITRINSEGFPVEAEHLDIRSVSQHVQFGPPSQNISEDHLFSPTDPIFVDGYPAPPGMVPGSVIRFTASQPPFLVHAARAIKTVLLLDKIANDYATDPLPFGYFRDATDEEPLEDDEINALLDKWERARKQRRWGYIESGLELEKLEWPTPHELQLIQARNHAILDVARAAGLDPEDVGIKIEGTTRTYQNAEQRRLDLIDFVVQPYISAVEDRLSMNDIIPRNLRARFDLAAFARADFKDRMEGYEVALKAGIMKRNEIRRREGWPDITKQEAMDEDPRDWDALLPPAASGSGNGKSPNGKSPNGKSPNGKSPSGNGVDSRGHNPSDANKRTQTRKG